MGATPQTQAAERLVENLLSAVEGTFVTFGTYLGDRLGYYDALAAGPLTPSELAERTDTHERYAREWLEHQTVAGSWPSTTRTPTRASGRTRSPRATSRC